MGLGPWHNPAPRKASIKSCYATSHDHSSQHNTAKTHMDHGAHGRASAEALILGTPVQEAGVAMTLTPPEAQGQPRDLREAREGSHHLSLTESPPVKQRWHPWHPQAGSAEGGCPAGLSPCPHQ